MDPLSIRNRVGAFGPETLRIRHEQILRGTPLFDLELVSSCNQVCSFCPRETMVRDARLMSEDTFSTLLSWMPQGAVAMLAGLGDATLHPLLSAWVARLQARGIPTALVTNGLRLDARLQDQLLESNIHEVQVSVHGLRAEVLRTVVTRGANPSRVRAHVERFASLAASRLRINFVETPENACEREDVEAWAQSLGARFYHRNLHNRGGSRPTGSTCASFSGCGIYAFVTMITADGRILPCVNDVRGEGSPGHVGDLDWPQVLAWKRATIEQGAWFPACQTCDDDYRWVLLDDPLTPSSTCPPSPPS